MGISDGFFRRLWRRIRGDGGDRAPIQPRPAEVYEPPASDAPLVVPARGDVYDFHVYAHLRWDSPSRHFDIYEIEEEAAAYQDVARERTMQTVWRHARSLDPLDPAGAELVLNDALATGFCWPKASPDLRCRPSVRVLMDPRLREQKAPLELRRVEQQLALARDEVVRARTEQWLRGFQELEQFHHLGKDERQFLLPFAASLVDGELATVTRALADERRARYDELVGVLAQAVRDHERVGLFEFANAYDKALRAFCRQMGVDLGKWHLADFGEAVEPVELGDGHPGAAR
ncbi:hypothetical protein GA0070606_1414 [Micromonospora citrea]|uniref:Uncharacterized protein n=1 Tax=Micromonospora citrea TaxID=47855 RepID=A0A1C6U4X9_9ACTN|nr:hypothetical protein [Micromonospora citrea]SCL49092.1 hypothetical protein GA0070606_1414 [Micromonospora citrea]